MPLRPFPATRPLFRCGESVQLLRPGRGRPAANHRASYGLLDVAFCDKRQIHSIPNLLLPPVVFTGLLIALYMWKSFMMVTFQNKIIYMPYMPPNARSEKISDYRDRLCGIEWREFKTRAADKTKLTLAMATVASGGDGTNSSISHHVYILYLQGNASSIPPRLPDHSWILREVRDEFGKLYTECGRTRFTEVALSYRGYWTSRGSPNEVGINQDTIAAVDWICQVHDNTYEKDEQGKCVTKPIFIIWGQSIGSGFATNLAASGAIPIEFSPVALLLETPFLSIRAMLATLYEEKWLPYRYLYPFLRNHLDSHKNLGIIAANRQALGLPPPQIFILQAGRDEVVPASHPEALSKQCAALGLPIKTKVVQNAYHNDAMYGRSLVADWLMSETAKIIRSDYSKEIRESWSSSRSST